MRVSPPSYRSPSPQKLPVISTARRLYDELLRWSGDPACEAVGFGADGEEEQPVIASAAAETAAKATLITRR